jgi:class 3 adenylate cyclase
METSQDQALLLEALSDKVLHQLPQAVWRNLFVGAERDSIRFEQRNLTLVHADADLPAGLPGSATEHFYQELQRLNTRHGGRLDPYVDATALVTFEDPGAAVRMAMELQSAARDVALRIGVVSGPCTLAFFRAQGRLWCTPLGSQPARAAEVAASAKPGGIVISPEAYDPAERRARLRADTRGAVDFRDSEVDLSTLAGGAQFRSVDILLA